MKYWPPNAMEMLRNTVVKIAVPSLGELAQKSYVDSLCIKVEAGTSLAEEIESLPHHLMVNVLEEMCEYPSLKSQLREILCNPLIVSRILRSSINNRKKLVKCFQWLETTKDKIVTDLADNFCAAVQPDCDDSHLLGFECSLRLGTFLSETGWHNEACKILNVSKKQAALRPIFQLQAMRPLLISQVFARKPSAYTTSVGMLALLDNNGNLPAELSASLYHALSICRYEDCKFDCSHEFARQALFKLDDKTSSNRLTIAIYRQLAKTCIARQKLRQAKLLITQAVSRAWHSYGSPSVIYAETLEDYAFYLVMMNAVDDSITVYSQAQNVLLQVYGPRNLQQTVTQGNLSFGVYLQAYIYRDLQMAKRYVEHATYLMEEMNASDHRLLTAVKKVDALIEADVRRFGTERNVDQQDSYQTVQPQLTVAEVKRLFNEVKEDV